MLTGYVQTGCVNRCVNNRKTTVHTIILIYSDSPCAELIIYKCITGLPRPNFLIVFSRIKLCQSLPTPFECLVQRQQACLTVED